MVKKYLYVVIFAMLGTTQATTAQTEKHQKIDTKDANAILSMFADEEFTEVKSPHVVSNEVYKQLAQDGWSNIEIIRIVDSFMQEQKARSAGFAGFGEYRKYWRPSAIISPSPDPMYPINYSETTEGVQKAMVQTFSNLDQSYERVFYTPEDRLNKKRNKGYFRHVACMPAGGRIHWIAVNPNDHNSVRCIPDGDAIWQTDNATDGFPIWRCITDNIPNRYHRAVSNSYALPVDPDDWNHLFAFMSNGSGGSVIYESFDAGETWTQIEGATHNSPKRGYAFKDAQGNLKLISGKGDQNWNINLSISEDKGKTWINIPLPADLRDTNTSNNKTGQWIQEFGFNQQDRDNILIPTSYSILVLKDGGRRTNGVFNIERMSFNVYDKEGTTLIKENTTTFPFADYMKENKQNPSPMFIDIDPNNPNNMWVALGNRSSNNSNNDQSAIYKTTDGGKNWITLKDGTRGIGRGNVYGNEVAWGWLGGFGVNFNNPQNVYGSSMSSAKSRDGGTTFNEFAWSIRMNGVYPSGSVHTMNVASHNADNHCIISHKSGRVFRGSDAGLLMLDPNRNNGEWLNISGNMGQMLFYQLSTNEFGNQMLFGNTQDINLQTYRGGRWLPQRGYEGSTAWVSPYGSRAYYPYGESGIANQDYGSWSKAETRADVHTGNWYISREGKNPDGSKFSVVKDFGQTSIKLDPVSGSHVKEFTLARDGDQSTIFVLTENSVVYSSKNEGATFTTVRTPSTSKTCIAVNPDNSQELYIAGNNDIMKTEDAGATWTSIRYNLPNNITKRRVLYHEGCGDIYLVCPNDGIFYLENGGSEWKLWMKGYNPAAFNNAIINYTTQEMIIDDYGRGIWIADLERPCNRYFQDGFALKELSNVDGTKTIGIDTKWTIPMYHYYEWSVNGTVVENPYQYLTLKDLKEGDKVGLTLTLRESPDVVTRSQEYVVAKSTPEKMDTQKGNMLTSDGSGRIDLGNVDLFFDDFTIGFWLNATSDGVILANRSVRDEDSKGWLLRIDNGILKFVYSPDHQLPGFPYEESAVVNKDEVNAGSIAKNEWVHIALTHERNGKVIIYVDGKKQIEKNRVYPAHTLNNAIYLSLFGDGFERYTLTGSIDELKIWNKALTADNVEQDMFAMASPEHARLIYYNNFNAATLEAQAETFSKIGMQPRTRAKVTVSAMSLPLGSDYSAKKKISTSDNQFIDGTEPILAVTGTSKQPTLTAYKYIDDFEVDEDSQFNLDYQDICAESFMIMINDAATLTATDKATIKFSVKNPANYANSSLYVSNTVKGKIQWERIATLQYDEATNTLNAENIVIRNINKKQLLLIENKEAIVVTLNNTTVEQDLVVGSMVQTCSFQAELVGGLEEPVGDYTFSFDQPNVKMQEPLQFVNGKATGRFTVDVTQLKSLNSTQQVTLTGADKRMMPLKFTVISRIIDNTRGRALSLAQGGANFGSATSFSKLNGQNKITMMTWVKYDNLETINSNRPILFWRDGSSSKATGIYVWGGDIGCHWNDETWSWSIRSGLKITAEDEGKWVHVAMVVDGSKMTIYLNGTKKVVSTRTFSNLAVNSPLLIGQNSSGETQFTGTFDNIAVWNRALSDMELNYFRSNNPDISDESLVCFFNSDLTNSENKSIEVISGLPLNTVGSTSYKSAFYPYASEATAYNNVLESGNPTMIMPKVTLPISGRSFRANIFNTTPYAPGIMNSREKYLQMAFWNLSFVVRPAFSSSSKVNIEFNHPAVVAGDSIHLLVRPYGQIKAYTKRYGVRATADKYIKFEIPGNEITSDIEMYMTVVQTSNRPEYVQLSAQGISNSNVVLSDVCDSIMIEAKVVGGNPSGSYTLRVAEDYATIHNPEIKFTSTQPTISRAVYIDRSKINKVGLNELTVTCDELSINPLHFTFSLEPKISLRLVNGESANRYVAKAPQSDMVIEATIEQGVFNDKIELDLTSDLNVNYSVNSAPITSNNQAVVDGITYVKGHLGELNEGWNLVGNPYLSVINLTESRNSMVSGITRYLYQWNEATRNFSTYDLTSYNSAHTTLPLGAFFVQAMSEDASLEIYPTAKEAKISRQMIRSSNATVSKRIVLGLYVEGVEVDQTIVYYEASAREGFLLNEDAPKMMSTDEQANQFFTYTHGDNVATAINRTTLVDHSVVALATATHHRGEMSIKVVDVVGFGSSDVASLKDKETGEVRIIQVGETLAFTPSDHVYPQGKGRFELIAKTSATGIDGTNKDGYQIDIQGGSITINGLDGKARVLIYTLAGSMVVNETVAGSEFTTSLMKGNYLVKILINNQEFTTKINVN